MEPEKLPQFEQVMILRLYGWKAEYRCTYCRLPIFLVQVPVIDKGKVYHPHCHRRANNKDPGTWDGTLIPKAKGDIKYKGHRQKAQEQRKKKQKRRRKKK